VFGDGKEGGLNAVHMYGLNGYAFLPFTMENHKCWQQAACLMFEQKDN
jgi:hypothetical protein